ncbi:MAG: hypothetical protein ABR579_01685 [Actinomycetota bacterium]
MREMAGRRALVGSIAVMALTSFSLFAGMAPASAATPYYLNATKTAPTAHCYTGYGPSSYTDLLATAPTNSATFAGSALFGCTQPYPAGAHISAGSGSLDMWFTNLAKASKNAKPCVTPWFLQHNATPTNAGTNITGANVNGNPSFTVPAGTTTPTKVTINFNVPDTTLSLNDQLMLWVDVRTQSGPCSQMTLYYGSAATPSDVSLPTLAG